jgi:DNA-directed RNA polymerase subunit RPC12/RpoP
MYDNIKCPYCGLSKITIREQEHGDEFDIWYQKIFSCNNCGLEFDYTDILDDEKGIRKLKILLNDKKFLFEQIRDLDNRYKLLLSEIEKAKPELWKKIIVDEL